MLTSTPKKTGRPLAFFKDRHGHRHEGLMRLADGRWRISGPEKYTFTERNEDLAVQRFKEWWAERHGVDKRLGKLAAHRDVDDAAVDMLTRTVEAGGRLDVEVKRAPDGQGYAVADETLTPKQWAWLGRQLIERPKWVAEKSGVEQVGYLPKLKAPARVPTFSELAGIWKTHFNSSSEQKRKCPIAFEDFCKVTGVKSIDGIMPESVVTYRDAIYSRKITGKSQSNVFTRIRRYLAFFRDRAIAIDEINKALDYLALLTPNETTVTLDPKPIDPADWKKLLAKAKGDDRAMILLMLNAAMYLQEVIRLEWSDIKDGCLVTHRAKTGKCVRVAVLWPETVEALAKVSRRGNSIFLNYASAPLGIKGAEMRFRALRDAAKVEVTSSQLRDGAYTAAVEANVTSNLCQLLVGHRNGLQDNYVKRRPKMVAPACDAIRNAYF